mmetsp:Transcript_72602/g.173274  ORF Transcript_72602/g.173274 Transcript_72602/m.173274 type:complete len:240 (+) Transcript_72602:298-1017(+)
MRSRGRRPCLLALPCRWEAHGAKVEAVWKVAEHLAVLGHVHVSGLQLFALVALALAAVHSVTAQVWTSVERKGHGTLLDFEGQGSLMVCLVRQRSVAQRWPCAGSQACDRPPVQGILPADLLAVAVEALSFGAFAGRLVEDGCDGLEALLGCHDVPCILLAPECELHHGIEGHQAVDQQHNRCDQPVEQVATATHVLLHGHVADGTPIDTKGDAENHILDRQRSNSSVSKPGVRPDGTR